jgi:hypothetical protein
MKHLVVSQNLCNKLITIPAAASQSISELKVSIYLSFLCAIHFLKVYAMCFVNIWEMLAVYYDVATGV